MKLLRSLVLSFSLYSRIPMPHIAWREEDMAGSLAFFPLVGGLTGGLICLVNLPFLQAEVPPAVRVLFTVLLPILVSGGFHMDGYMDTEDALRSYASREKRLAILKDPHIGAFALIGMIRILLLFSAAVCLILLHRRSSLRIVGLFGLLFVISRCLSALLSLYLPKARKEGMLQAETKGCRGSVLFPVAVQLAACLGAALYLDAAGGAAVLAVFALHALWYGKKMVLLFGGVTGDTAGYYVVSAETAASLALALRVLLIR